MRTHLRVMAAAALILLGLATGCERTTPGTLAMTTQPGASTSTSTSTRTPTTTSRPTTSAPTSTSVPEVPAPPNALTMTCSEFTKLDEATQLAVIREILKDERSVLGQGDEDIAKTLAETVCQFLPDSTVNEVLLGGSPP